MDLMNHHKNHVIQVSEELCEAMKMIEWNRRTFEYSFDNIQTTELAWSSNCCISSDYFRGFCIIHNLFYLSSLFQLRGIFNQW